MTYCENCEKYKFCKTRKDIEVSTCSHFKPLKKIYNKSQQKKVPQYNKYNNSKRKLRDKQLNKQKEKFKKKGNESLRLIAKRVSKKLDLNDKNFEIQNQIRLEKEKMWTRLCRYQ